MFFVMPQTAVAFDIYGTLADTAGVARALEAHTEDAAGFASRWRDKQLEYTFRRTVMGVYADFAQCTKEALLYVCAERGISLNEEQRASLTAEYARLPLFADAPQALNDLRANDNLRLFAFSNGKAAAVQEWLSSRGVLECFADIVSADEIKQFKPSPEVYKHFLARANATADSSWLVSGNPFDIIGAQNTGMRGAWIKRNNAVFDLWEGVKPTATISSLTELAVIIKP